MDDRYYIDETCSVCDTECGSRLCDDCKAETEILFKALCLGSFSGHQICHLDMQLDGVYLTDLVQRDDLASDTARYFKALCLENFNSDQLLHLANRLDGVYLTDFLKG